MSTLSGVGVSYRARGPPFLLSIFFSSEGNMTLLRYLIF